jgi:hypothetical protein
MRPLLSTLTVVVEMKVLPLVRPVMISPFDLTGTASGASRNPQWVVKTAPMEIYATYLGYHGNRLIVNGNACAFMGDLWVKMVGCGIPFS